MNITTVAQQLISEGVIEVRADGTWWRLRNRNAMPFRGPRRLETKSKKRGYLLVKLYLCGKSYLTTAHRLTWMVLKGPIPPGLDINHKDGNRHNNRPENLELVTRGKNHEHAYRVLGRRARGACRPEIISSIAAQAKRLRGEGASFLKIAVALKVSIATAYKAVKTP